MSRHSRYDETQALFNRGELLFNNLYGWNEYGNAESKIEIVGELDQDTVDNLYENYDDIASNLQVYPTVKIVSNDYQLYGGLGGFYLAEENFIKIVEAERLRGNLAKNTMHFSSFEK